MALSRTSASSQETTHHHHHHRAVMQTVQFAGIANFVPNHNWKYKNKREIRGVREWEEELHHSTNNFD